MDTKRPFHLVYMAIYLNNCRFYSFVSLMRFDCLVHRMWLAFIRKVRSMSSAQHACGLHLSGRIALCLMHSMWLAFIRKVRSMSGAQHVACIYQEGSSELGLLFYSYAINIPAAIPTIKDHAHRN